jgi:hypothetical protein
MAIVTMRGCWAGHRDSALVASLLPNPVFPERPQSRKGLTVLLSFRRRLAGDDVVEVADRETVDLHTPPPRILESLDAIGSEDQVEVERTVFQLDESFTSLKLARFRLRQIKADFTQRGNDGMAILRRWFDEKIDVLRRIGNPNSRVPDLPMNRYRTQ